MKKFLSAALACLMLVSMVLVLASCGGGLSGTYVYEEDDMKATLAFKGDKVTATTEYDGEVMMEMEYTYELNDDKTEMTLTASEDAIKDTIKEMIGEEAYEALDAEALDAMIEEYAEEMNETVEIEIGDDYIEIEDMKYEKQ